jgi:hypothetical protein
MLAEDMLGNKCYFQVRIPHGLRLISIRDLFTDSPSYQRNKILGPIIASIQNLPHIVCNESEEQYDVMECVEVNGRPVTLPSRDIDDLQKQL